MLPEGWKLVRLGEIAQISSGGTPDRSQARYWNGNIPWVTTGEIQFNTITDTEEKITAEGLKSSSAKLFPPGTLLMAMYGQGKTRGQVAKLGIAATTNQNSAAILLDEEHDPDFYLHYLASRYDDIREFGNSGGISHLNAGLLRQIEVPTGPMHVQRSMAKIFSAWDVAIAITQKLLANSQLTRHLASQTLLSGRRRLRNHTNWSRRRLADLISESRVPGSPGNIARKLTVKLYGKGVVAKDERRQGSEATAYYRRRAGQFIYSKLDFLNGAFGVVPEHLDGYESTLDLPAFDFRGAVEPRWLLYYVSRENFYKSLLGLANGGRKARRVSPADLLQISVDYPELEEQKAIADAIDFALEDERKWETMLHLLKTEKQALMTELLTGKRRVPEKAATTQESA